MAVPEDGVGGLPGVVELLYVGAEASKVLRVECITPCVVLATRLSRCWSPASCGAGGLASSSSLERPVFAPPIALTTSSLWLWLEVTLSMLGRVRWALPLLYWF
jgi:hypothetical protein